MVRRLVAVLTRDRITAIATAFLFAFSQSLWSQATTARVYALGALLLALALLELGQAERALPDAERSIQLGPNNPFARQTRGRILAELGRLEEAAPLARSAFEEAPDTIPAGNTAHYVIQARHGLVCAAREEWDDALPVLEEAYPNLAGVGELEWRDRVAHALAGAYETLGLPEEAEYWRSIP